GFETFAQRIADPTMAPLVVRQPDCDHRFEKFAAGLVGRQPDHLENLSFGSAVYGLATSGFDPADGGAHWPVHELDRVFAVQSAYLNQLVEQLGFALATSVLVAHSHLLDILVFALLTHFGWGGHPVSSILAQRILKLSLSSLARVSFILAQFAIARLFPFF